MNKAVIAGVGPGHPDLVTPRVREAISASDLLIGGRRHLALWGKGGIEAIPLERDLDRTARFIEEAAGKRRICVLSSGDPCFYGIGSYMREHVHGVAFEILPGISSVQYLCCAAGLSIQDMTFISVHGREGDVVGAVSRHRKTAILTGKSCGPADICRMLAEYDLGNLRVVVGENLSYEEEKVTVGAASELAEKSFAPLNVVIVQNDAPHGPHGFGIPDDLFLRGSVPMTKEEVRAVSLSKLRLRQGDVVYDIGAGTGSVALECALFLAGGPVFAFEGKPGAVSLIRDNCRKLHAGGVTVVEGWAPECLAGYPIPSKVFIGGSGGRAGAIIAALAGLKAPLRVVANTITPESSGELLAAMKGRSFSNIEVVTLNVAVGQAAGEKHMMKARNPVTIIAGDLVG